jgi:hypothetical protein
MNKVAIQLETWDKVANYISGFKVGVDFINAVLQIQKELGVDMYDAISKGQLASKVWALKSLWSQIDRKDAKIAVCGGWYGTLPALALDNDAYFPLRPNFYSIDIDPDCEPVAKKLNARSIARGAFTAITANMYEHDYSAYDVIINTSCEHIDNIENWLTLIPARTQVLLQNNNFFDHMEHVNCVASLDEFIAKAPLSKISYAGEMVLPLYTRYMVIGTK